MNTISKISALNTHSIGLSNFIEMQTLPHINYGDTKPTELILCAQVATPMGEAETREQQKQL